MVYDADHNYRLEKSYDFLHGRGQTKEETRKSVQTNRKSFDRKLPQSSLEHPFGSQNKNYFHLSAVSRGLTQIGHDSLALDVSSVFEMIQLME